MVIMSEQMGNINKEIETMFEERRRGLSIGNYRADKYI